jgi:hypothetical protein
MTPDEQREAVEAGRAFIRLYYGLAAESAATRSPRYKVRPKWHAMEHIIEAQSGTLLNCRCWSCFGPEDWIGKISKLFRKARDRTAERYLANLAFLKGP